MTRLILIRHGETDWNVENRRQGRNDRPFNSKGTKQAQLVADHVNFSFDVQKIWSSPLQRCTATAALLDAPVSTSDLLLEIDYGEWEGMLDTEIDAQYPDRYRDVFEDGGNRRISMDPPGGEMRSNLPVRARQFLDESRIGETSPGAPDDGDVAIVGHGSAMGGLLVALLGLPDRAMQNFVIDNCSVSTVQMGAGMNRLTTLNHTAHLAAVDGA